MTEESVDALEMLRCAEINFGNFALANPSVACHPYFNIAVAQLVLGIEALEVERK